MGNKLVLTVFDSRGQKAEGEGLRVSGNQVIRWWISGSQVIRIAVGGESPVEIRDFS